MSATASMTATATSSVPDGEGPVVLDPNGPLSSITYSDEWTSVCPSLTRPGRCRSERVKSGSRVAMTGASYGAARTPELQWCDSIKPTWPSPFSSAQRIRPPPSSMLGQLHDASPLRSVDPEGQGGESCDCPSRP